MNQKFNKKFFENELKKVVEVKTFYIYVPSKKVNKNEPIYTEYKKKKAVCILKDNKMYKANKKSFWSFLCFNDVLKVFLNFFKKKM